MTFKEFCRTVLTYFEEHTHKKPATLLKYIHFKKESLIFDRYNATFYYNGYAYLLRYVGWWELLEIATKEGRENILLHKEYTIELCLDFMWTYKNIKKLLFKTKTRKIIK